MTDFKTQLDAAIARLQQVEQASVAAVQASVSALQAAIQSLNDKLATQAPGVDISPEIQAMNQVVDQLQGMAAALPQASPTTALPPDTTVTPPDTTTPPSAPPA